MKNSEKIKELEALEEKDEQTLEDIEGLKNYEKSVCFWCGDVFELSYLYHTNLKGCLCKHCIEAIRSRGEKIKVEDSYWCCEDEIEAMEDDE
jgi:hypothetical protein